MNNPFSETYKKLSNAELLDIIRNPNDYQPLAFEAAQVELDGRQLTEEQISSARAIVEEEQAKVKSVDDKIEHVNTVFTGLFRALPYKRNYHIQNICILMAVLSCVYAIKELRVFFTKGMAVFSDLTFLDFAVKLPIFLLPIATLLFWRRIKIGWILLSFVVTYTFFKYLTTIGHRSVIDIILYVFVFGIVQIALCRKPLRELYSISRRTATITIGSIVFISALLWCLIASSRLFFV